MTCYDLGPKYFGKKILKNGYVTKKEYKTLTVIFMVFGFVADIKIRRYKQYYGICLKDISYF